MKFTEAGRPTTCNECAEPVKIGDRVLWATYAVPRINGIVQSVRAQSVRAPLCVVCGQLYLESQDHPIERMLRKSGCGAFRRRGCSS